MTFRRNPLAIALAGLALAAPAAQAHPVSKPDWGAVEVRQAGAEIDWASVAVGVGGSAALATLAMLGLGRMRPAG
jgi:hypothetical protein